ncbi:TPA: hypothetical protein SMT38_001104 [Proteus mirabilis]|nr:hypothetical protein [Proteus mirabilis]
MCEFIKKQATALLTLVGVLIGSLVGGITQYNITKTQTDADYKKYCIQLVDKKEETLRLQSEKFLSSIGNLVSYGAINKITSHQDIQNAFSPIIISGYSLSTFAPDKLNHVTHKIISSTIQAANADNYDSQEEAIESIKDSFGKWPDTYRSAIAELEAERKNCK